jgi:hypothetical protein
MHRAQANLSSRSFLWLTHALFSEQCFVGLVLEVGLSLRGHEHDLLAYIDGLTYSNIRGVEGIEIPMRHVEKSEPRISSLTVTMHSTKKVIALRGKGVKGSG